MRKELATELGELTYERAKLEQRIREIALRSNQIATELEQLEKPKNEDKA